METAQRNLIAFRLLQKVFSDGAYSSIELNKKLSELSDERDKAYISRIFYGILSKNVQLDYILSKLAAKKPKPTVALVIKMGVYMLRFMNVPDYAVIDTQVELIKILGKRELSGFVNAVLRRSGEVKLPIRAKSTSFELSVNYSCPEWIVKKLIADYGIEFAREFLVAELDERTHIRVNTAEISQENFVKLLKNYELSPSGIYAEYSELVGINKSLYTVQSLSSMLATEYYAATLNKDSRVLDMCAAPGGKSAYLYELTGADITACDVHPHRVELMKSYFARMKVKAKAEQNDATVYRAEFDGKFDCVICDVPCSGLGVMHSKPDVLINRKESDVAQLSKLQSEILSAASKYVKSGGALCYSTCTVLKEENEDVVNAFLAQNPCFSLEKRETKNVSADGDGFVRLSPQKNRCDGFFVAALRRSDNA